MTKQTAPMEIWPAIDLRGGRCVRLEQGDYGRETVFGDDPVSMAAQWVAQGAERLHLVDLDGARSGTATNAAAVQAIVGSADVPCQLGGGVRDERTIEQFLAWGVARLVIGTRALREPDWFARMCDRFPQRLVLGLDARDGRVASDGWLTTSDVGAVELARRLAGEPLAGIVYTDIARDGMLRGPNLEAMAELQAAVGVPVIASGGVSGVEDVVQLARIPMAGAIIGRALYEGRVELPEAIQAARRVYAEAIA